MKTVAQLLRTKGSRRLRDSGLRELIPVMKR